MEIEELVKAGIAIFVLILLIGATYFLLGEKGGELLSSLRNVLRFG